MALTWSTQEHEGQQQCKYLFLSCGAVARCTFAKSAEFRRGCPSNHEIRWQPPKSLLLPLPLVSSRLVSYWSFSYYFPSPASSFILLHIPSHLKEQWLVCRVVALHRSPGLLSKVTSSIGYLSSDASLAFPHPNKSICLRPLNIPL